MSNAWGGLWAEAKRVDMVEQAHRLGARLKPLGHDLVGPCPLGCASQDGFVVTPGKQLFYCRPSGARGDAVDMVMHVKGYDDVADALEFITGKRPPRKGERGDTELREPALAPQPTVRPAMEVGRDGPSTTTTDAMKLWRPSVDGRGTLAERYLNQRKLGLDAYLAVYVLRWHPGIGAMLALFRNIHTGAPQAISRTFLDQDARKIGRKFLGPVGGAAVMLDPFDEVLEGLHIGAGVETCMTARQHPRMNFRPTWALGSDTAIADFPVLGGIDCLTLIQENDTKNNSSQRACDACALRWHAAGREVLINTPNYGNDLNDAIRGKAS